MSNERPTRFWQSFLQVLGTLVPIIIGAAALGFSQLGLIADDRHLLEMILAILLTLAIAELIQRFLALSEIDRDLKEIKRFANELEKIRNDLTALLQHGARVSLISGGQQIWEAAKAILKSAGAHGMVFDSCSFKNPEEYERELERQRADGAKIVRYVCADSGSSVEDLIPVPGERQRSRGGEYHLRHIPNLQPFDCLVVKSGDGRSISAIIAFRTNQDPVAEYASAFHVHDNRLANDLFEIHQTFYAQASEKHMRHDPNECNICGGINRLCGGTV